MRHGLQEEAGSECRLQRDRLHFKQGMRAQVLLELEVVNLVRPVSQSYLLLQVVFPSALHRLSFKAACRVLLAECLAG